MLLGNAIGFIDNLSPSVLACRFRGKRHQQVCRKLKVVVAFAIRENKVRLLVFLSYNLLFINNVARIKDRCQMMFQ